MKIDGEKLQKKRVEAGVSLTRLASSAGYKSTQNIYRLEKEGGVINDNIAKAIAKALRCTVEQFSG